MAAMAPRRAALAAVAVVAAVVAPWRSAVAAALPRRAVVAAPALLISGKELPLTVGRNEENWLLMVVAYRIEQ